MLVEGWDRPMRLGSLRKRLNPDTDIGGLFPLRYEDRQKFRAACCREEISQSNSRNDSG